MEKQEELSDSDEESYELSVVWNGQSASVDLAGLREWYEKYRNEKSLSLESPALSILEDDVLDLDSIEQRVSTVSSHMTFDGIFCGACQIILNNWPVNFAQYDALETTRTLNWHSIFHVEAAARRGCRFCSTMMHILITTDYLHVFRCVELRLEALGEIILPTIYVDYTKISLNPPGQVIDIIFPSELQYVTLETNGAISAPDHTAHIG